MSAEAACRLCDDGDGDAAAGISGADADVDADVGTETKPREARVFEIQGLSTGM